MGRTLGVSNYSDLIVALSSKVLKGPSCASTWGAWMDGILDILCRRVWAAAIRIATPYMFGVLGAAGPRAGVLNLIGNLHGRRDGRLDERLFGADLWTGVLIAAHRRDDRAACPA